jgi:hypothetical protein
LEKVFVYVSDNLTTLKLPGSNQLKEIIVYRNNLKEIDLSQFSNLEKVYVLGLNSLTTLKLPESNQLRNIEIAYCNNLEKVVCFSDNAELVKKALEKEKFSIEKTEKDNIVEFSLRQNEQSRKISRP